MAGGATTAELVAAVSNAGGLGSLAARCLEPASIKKAIQHIRNLTDKPFSVNLFTPEFYKAEDSNIEKTRKAVQAACIKLNSSQIKYIYVSKNN